MKNDNFVIFSWNQVDRIKTYISIHKITFHEINSKVIIKQATSSLTFYSWSESSRNFDFWIYAYKKNKGEKIPCHIASIARNFFANCWISSLWQNCQLLLKNKNSHFNYSVQVWYLNYSDGVSFMKWIYFWLLPKSGKK